MSSIELCDERHLLVFVAITAIVKILMFEYHLYMIELLKLSNTCDEIRSI